ncbi:MAG TPA: SRPBCC family protein [Trinickia sp.]|uniref:SRPBCC family protein n=1 Tax=Trinickia sp. TaxID=2571163 RepID=UPI002C30C4E8|nr:SRPBCC family protein [Trinickia sp.]HTI17627.1 SRPBCC family protein [Trinickia sp.]
MPNTIYISDVINAPIDAVWSIMRDFNGMPAYHPGIIGSEMEAGARGDTVGGVRRLALGPDAYVREQLLMLDDFNHAFTYKIIEGTLPVRHYVAGVRLSRVTAGERTFAEWWADFEVTGGADRTHWIEHIGNNVFGAGFAGVAAKLSAA